MDKEKKLAAIRVRGITEIRIKVEDTLKMLRLYRKNYCTVIPDNAVYTGMLKKAKDYIAWGEIDDETFRMLVDKRGEEYNGKEDARGMEANNDFVIINGKKIKKYFRLSPPKKGFGSKGIKHSFQQGGALGYRGDKINDLIRRMV